VNYLRGHRQALNLYFEMPKLRQRIEQNVQFTVAIENLDACTCVTDSIYENV
jgi:hypothetical protein